MNFNAKLLVVALIVAMIFSVGAVSAAENNLNATSSDLTQVPHGQVVSVAEPTVQEVETIDLETSDTKDTAVTNEITSGSDDLKSTDSKKESLKESKKGNSLLGVSNEENVLATTIYPTGSAFSDIRDAIAAARPGDIVDLRGNTFYGYGGDITCYKHITITNGSLNGNSYTASFTFQNCILENLSISNLHTRAGMSVNYCTLNNVSFDNVVSDDSCDIAVRYCNLESVNFTNCHSLLPADPKEEDFEKGVMIVTYGSTFNNCYFINCSSNRHSGAICVAGEPGNTANITNCVFDNCTSGVGGAVYLHGTGLNANRHSNIINCTFKNCEATEWGGALGSSQDYLNVENCDFINNSAKQGAAFMVGGITHGLDGDNSEGNYNIMKDCYFHNNTGSEEGGAVHITGHHNSAIDCHFDDNYATNGKGAAIYVEGDYGLIQGSTFVRHESEMGTVYIEGNYFNCTHSTFTDNNASHGGAGIYVEGDHTYIYDSTFKRNNASMHGGAIHTIGDYARILNSVFEHNDAIPSSTDVEYGLGGAIYIDGNNNEISFSKFKYNTARNGSAIYNRGENLVLNDDTFESNQAWSYFLFTEALPPESYWSEDLAINVNVTLVAGDNLINAIYNDMGVMDIYFYNVTYWMKPTDLYPTGKRTTSEDEIHPVLGVENSQGGKYLYQDAREDDQVVNINITFKDGQVFEYSGKTNMNGSVSFPITKENMSDGQFHPGIYTVNAEHPDDEIYTAISNSTTFTIHPHVDISVTKTSNKDVYFVGENAIFIITVSGVGTNATNVVVDDILPDSFKFVSASATQGEYDSVTNRWNVGFLPHLASQTLTLTVQTTELGAFDNVVIANCTERDWNLSNNRDNKTIHVDLYYTKEVNVTQTSAGEYVEYYLRVFNRGTSDYTEIVRVHDLMPDGIRYESYELVGADLVRFTNYAIEQVWEITNISAGYRAKITVKAKALKDGIWNNTMRVWDYPSVNATVNVTSNADLRVIKEVSSEWVNKGDIINWTIQVKNEGPSIAMGAYVTDILPNGLAIVGFTDPTKGNYNRNTNLWTIGDMTVGETATLIITTRVTISAHNITNVASVNSSTPDPNPENNEDNATTYFNPDVTIQKLVSNQTTSHGSVVSWTIIVTNNGPNDASGVYVIDRLPSGLNYISSTRTKGSAYNPTSGRWTVGDLAEGESATLTINTEVDVYDGYISNNATVYSNDDSNPDNNYDENFTQVITKADVGVVKLVSNQTSRYGDEIVWNVIVTNYGPNIAENVVLIDFLPINDLKQTRQPTVSKGQISHQGVTGRWDIGDMAVGETQSCQVYTKVITTATTIINVVNVTSDTKDPNPSNNRAENGTDVPPECDIGVVKRVNNITPNKGDYVIWTITVTNHGPNVAENVVMTDVLPAGLKYRATNGTYSVARNTWTVGNLNVREARSITITTEVVDTGSITNEVTVTTDTYDRNLTNNYDNKTIEVPAIADLAIVKEVSNKTPNYGDEITWTINVTNNGPNTARNVIVNDTLPEGLIYITHKSNPAGLLFDQVHGIWQIGDLAASKSVSLIITTRVNVSNKTITNIAVVKSDTPDNDTTNNEANNTTTIGPVADLEIIKTVDNHSPKKGDNVTWTVVVTNKGPDTAINAIAREILPEGLILIRAYPTGQSSYDLRTNIWYLQNMTSGQSINMTLVTQVNVTKKVLTNIIVVTSDTPDPDLTNNEANATIDVGHEADLGIIKTVSNSTPKRGDNITWAITVKNNGPDDAVEVYVNDTLPKGLVWISDNGNGTYNHITGIWTIGTLTNQSSLTLTIVTLVNITNTNITNVAVVDSDTNDPNPGNNTDNDTVKVRPEADLLVYKFVNNNNSNYNDEIVWTIYVHNNGPDTAVDAYVYDELPAGLKYNKYNATMGSYDVTTHKWTIGNLTSGKNANLTIFTTVNITNGTIPNVAVVNSSTYDPNPDNNNDTASTDVESVADLEVIKEVSNKKPHFGEEITWIITVINHGPCDAFNVNVTDNLPKGLIYQTDDSNGAYNADTGIWTIGNLTNGSRVVLNIITKVNLTNDTITNVAVVNSTTPDNNTENNKDNNTTDVPPEADLEIIKLVSNSTAHKGNVITWTIIVTNKGPDNALEVYVRDILPEGLVLTGYSRTKGIFDQNDMTWYIKSLAKGESQNLTLTTLVNVTNKNLTNVVTVTNDVYDPNETNNEANNTTNVDPEADLEVIKTAMNSTYNKGDIVVWNITVINHGPDAAVDVRLIDVAQEGLIFIDETYEIYHGLQIIGRNLGTLQVGESVTLFIKTLVNATNITLVNAVVVFTFETHDPNPDNNYDNDTIKANPKADLVVEKFVSANVTKTGEEITWTIKVTNNGPDVSVNTKVSDKLPAGLIYNGHKAEIGNYDPESGVWIVGDLANGESKVLEIKTIVNITNKTIVNVANVTGDTPGNKTNGTNNTTSAPKADLVVVKVVSDKNPKFGDLITWTVTVTNKGPDVAKNVNVTDKLPAGLIYQFDDSKGKYDVESGLWIVGDLANGESKSLVITTKVNITNKTIENIANAISDTPGDSTPGNNTTDVGPIADLAIVKFTIDSPTKYNDVVIWTINVTNHGPDAAKDVYVKDVLPKEVLYYSHVNDVGLYDPHNGIWQIGDMENGKSHFLSIITTVLITEGNITNVAVVNSSTPDNNTENNVDNDTTEVIDVNADLEVIKIVSSQTAKYDDLIIWTIKVTNHGPDDAYEVYVEDELPGELEYISHDADIGLYDSSTGIWDIGYMVNGESFELVIYTSVISEEGNITNVAVVNSSTPDGNPDNNEANNTTVVEKLNADLAVVKYVSNANAKKGDTIVWTIVITNNGPDVAYDTYVEDKLPEGLTYVSHTADNGLYDSSRGIWYLGTIENGDSFTLNITTLVNIDSGNITNVAVANSTTPDNNTDNNKGNNTTTVDTDADLEIVKKVSNKNPKFGEEITWTITVTNNGPSDAKNVKVTDKLPAGLIFNGADGNYNKDTGLWIVGDLANGKSASLVIRTIVNITNKTITNVANVTSDTPDSNKTNNNANNTTDVDPKADLVVIKEVSNKNPNKGDVITWTITVTNNGPDVSINTKVTDNLPSGLIYKGADGQYDPTTGVWTVGDLANGESRSLVITTLVDITNATIKNVATPTSDTPGNNTPGNNTTDVPPEADLEIIKLVSNTTAHKGDIITWTVIVTNNGPDAAENVYVNDILPNGLVYNAHTTTKGLFDSDKMLWYITTLANGESQKLTIQTVVNITNSKITNIVNVTSDTPDSDKTNNVANNTTDIPPEADIGVVKEVNVTECSKDQIVEWTITMTNHGPDGANNVIVRDNLPDTLIFISSDGDYDPDTGIWTIDYLASGETRVLTIITKVNTSGVVIVNNVTVTSGVYDPDMSNNNASNKTTVVENITADLEVMKIVSDQNPRKGDIIDWIIIVVNNGPGDAKDVTVSDKLPTGLKFISADGDYDADTGVWTIGDLANGKSETLVIKTSVEITNANITNVVVVNSTTPDNDTSNNKDNDTTEIDPEADVKVVKVVSNPTPSKGDLITWTIIVTNLGPDAAENVVVEEKLPEGLTLVSARGSKGQYSGDIWTIGTLENGEIATLTLTTEVTASSGTITNVVIANSSTYDPNKTNNKDSEKTTPKSSKDSSADLELIKAADKVKVKVGETFIWTIIVINHGPDKATGVWVEEMLDTDSYELIAYKASKGTFNVDDGEWLIGDMENGETVTLQIMVKALVEGEVENYASVDSDTPDPNPDNNEDSSTVVIVEDGGDDNPDDPNEPSTPKGPTPKGSTPTMHATGNPIFVVLLALLSIVGVTLRRKD